MFRHPGVDRFLARAHPAFPAVVFGSLGALSLVVAAHRGATPLLLIGGAALGAFAFSFIEYALHRFVFHRRFDDSREGRIAWFMTHGYHHTYPRDRTRLVMPPLITFPLAAGFGLVLPLFFGAALGFAVLAGVIAGYVAYDSLHFLVHHVRTKRGVLGYLRTHHLLHHGSGNQRFGVSSPLWDVLLGTGGRKRMRPAAREASP